MNSAIEVLNIDFPVFYASEYNEGEYNISNIIVSNS